jgi:hypothetical protein
VITHSLPDVIHYTDVTEWEWVRIVLIHYHGHSTEAFARRDDGW